jgi:F0F1-type ATP synthase assembly protein I
VELQDDQNQKKNNPLSTYAQFSGIAFQMIAIIGIGVYLGIKLDEKYPNKYKLFTLILSLLAIGIALYSVIKQVSDFSNKQTKSDDKRSN